MFACMEMMLICFLLSAAADAPGGSDRAAAILNASGVSAGLCVQLGCRDGELTAGLAAGGRLLVHALAADEASLGRARATLRRRRLYGVASVDRCDFRSLPYADNMVNLVVAEDVAALLRAGLPAGGITRILRPGGVAMLGGKDATQLGAALKRAGLEGLRIVRASGTWARLVKPRPAGMDDWTHKGYDASNVAVSRDSTIEPVTGLRWLAGPYWPAARAWRTSTWAMVSQGGRIFFLSWNERANLDKRPAEVMNTLHLIARDAFNGVFLWSRPVVVMERAVDPAGLKGLPATQRAKRLGAARSGLYRRQSDLLAAVGGKVYTVIDGDVVALDAATGKTLTTWEKGTSPSRLVVHEGDLILAGGGSVRAIDLAGGKVRWRSAFKARDVLVGSGRVFALDDHTDPRRHELAAFDLKTGRERWRTRKGGWGGWRRYWTWYHAGGVLAFAYGKRSGTLHVFSAETGRPLWSLKGFGWVDVFYMDGLIWVRLKQKLDPPESGTDWFEVGLDPHTGSQRRRVRVGRVICNGCYRSVGLERYFLGTRPLVFISRKDGKVHRFHGGRHACQMGVCLANGLVYTMPQSCQCGKDAIRGYAAFAANRIPQFPGRAERLRKGPAFGAVPAGAPGEGEPAWPTYRHDPQRSGATPSPVPGRLAVIWTADLAGAPAGTSPVRWDWSASPNSSDRLTAPVIAGGRVFVSLIESHRVAALDARTGREVWSFTAGGRLDTPPTIWRGLCLFGSRDGWVYCLRAADGKLVWRYLAAPVESRIVAFGQVESLWPVTGGVLVDRGAAYCLAGRSSAADGGNFFHALDPATGRRLKAVRFRKGGLCDLLVSDGREVHAANDGARHRLPRGPSAPAGPLPHLGSAPRVTWALDSSWRRPGVAGRLAYAERFDKLRRGKRHFYRRFGQIQRWRGYIGQLAVGRPDAEATFAYRLTNTGARIVAWRAGRTAWTADMPQPRQVEAMILAGDVLFAAGAADRFDRAKGGFVRSLSAGDGKLLDEFKLPAPPAFEGLAAAGKHLYLSTQHGKLLCLGGK